MSAAALPQTTERPTPNAPRLFGTDGIRKVVGREITPVFVAEVGSAIATYLQGSGDVLIARDFRTSSDAMARLLSGALLMDGINVRELGVMPTPCLQFNVRALGAAMGLTVTASHNPTEFNGIKFTGPEGTEIPRDSEEILERSIFRHEFVRASWDHVGTYRVDPDAVDRYTSSILRTTDVEAIRAAAPLVVLDPGNGTSAVTSPVLLRELGCRVLTLNANPDGYFPGRPSEPNEENLWALRKAVVELGAVVGIAHDGDADRASFVDEHGTYLPGDVTMALFAKHRLTERDGGVVVTSVTSSTLVEDVVRSGGGELQVTRSGSLPVARRVLDCDAIFAGEENGGYYWPEHQVARDGPMSSAKMVELLVRLGRPLSELVGELPRYHLSKTKVPVADALKTRLLAKVHAELEREADRIVTLDGQKAYFPDGWLLVRPSGTEPICRVYAEARSAPRAKELMDHGVEMVRREVETLGGTTHGTP
ncbi:MAG: phosphoglucosamine mutase [Thermoplasmata archaeon]|nr:phosphoglucosamine mutase [Thermoplasmata archaeon]